MEDKRLKQHPDTESHRSQVSCIVPAYNEAQRIGGVLAALVGHPMIKEIIVVDDASTDGTAQVVAAFQDVRLIALQKNAGKTAALDAGIRASTGSLLLLVDADLIGLSPLHITNLILPVVEGRAEIAISLRENAPWLWRWIGLDYISGERVFARSILGEEFKALPRFGFEVYLNSLCIRQRTKIAVVKWMGVESPYKNRKYGLVQGVKADMKMILDISRTVSPFGLLLQILRMLRLRVKVSDRPALI